MEDNELYGLRTQVAKRLGDYCGCSEESALKFIKVIRSSFCTEGGLLYTISDNLSNKGY